jgi:hypothetical protein
MLNQTEKTMKPYLWPFLLAIVYGFTALISGQAMAEPVYSLKTVEANPIPKDKHFLLWKEVALEMCSDSVRRFNLARAECLNITSKRADSCALQLAKQSPALITTTSLSKSIARPYLDCATPYYFCNGVEVKTEQEVRAKCAHPPPSQVKR